MKAADEIQRAHDQLVGIILDEVPVVVSDVEGRHMQIAANVLCWVLEHDHNEAFARLLEELQRRALELGYDLRKEADDGG